jgi:hypothetical protein
MMSTSTPERGLPLVASKAGTYSRYLVDKGVETSVNSQPLSLCEEQ